MFIFTVGDIVNFVVFALIALIVVLPWLWIVIGEWLGKIWKDEEGMKK